MSGVWWQRVWVNVPDRTVAFAGDATAVPKSMPILWRYGQDWHCLEVGPGHQHGYRLYFSTETLQMSHRKLLTARFVMVREGPEPVVFWVEDDDGKQLLLGKTGRMVPAKRSRPDRSSSDASSIDYLRALGDMVKV